MSKARDKSKLFVDGNGDAELSVLVNATPDQISGVTTAKQGYLNLPAGSCVERPTTAVNGAIRYNTDIATLEFFFNKVWFRIVAGASNGQR